MPRVSGLTSRRKNPSTGRESRRRPPFIDVFRPPIHRKGTHLGDGVFNHRIAPGIAATAIFAFVVSWSELLFAISFTTETSMRTLSAGLLYMVGQYEVQWGPLSAGVILSTVPVAVLFSFLQRHLIHGLTAGAVKG